VTATVTTSGTRPSTVAKLDFGMDAPEGTTPLISEFAAPYTFVLPSADFPDGNHTIYVHATMRDGFVTPETTQTNAYSNGTVSSPLPSGTWTPATGTTPDAGQPLVVGDVGDGAGGETQEANVVNLIKSWNPNLMLYLGDVYDNGTYTEYKNYYDPSNFYGAFKSITNPVIGNHEYGDKTAGLAGRGYFYYWGNVPHYYSYNVAGWHFIALDANSNYIGSTNTNKNATAQLNWLQNDLATNTSPCVIAYYHEPLYTIGKESAEPQLQSWWNLFVQNHVTLVLNGHNHDYERWNPIGLNGNLDPNGVTEIVDGTGGHSSQPPVTSDARVGYSTTGTVYGATRLALSPTKADYSFVQTDGTTNTTLDSGSVQCRGLTPDSTPPSVPTGVSATAVSAADVQVGWSASTDDTAVTGYNVYRDGVQIGTTGASTTSYDDTSVSASTTYSYTISAFDAAGNTSAQSDPAPVTTPAAGGTTLTFHGADVADSYINASNPTTNYGHSVTLRTDADPQTTSLLRFSVSGTTGTVTNATLKVYATSKSQGFSIYRITDPTWTEAGVTYNNQPAIESTPIATSPVTAAGWVTVDISSAITGNGTYDLELVSSSTTASAFSSREATTNQPDLVITTVT
jgi:hypothetical protein